MIDGEPGSLHLGQALDSHIDKGFMKPRPLATHGSQVEIGPTTTRTWN